MIAIPFADLSFLPGARGGRKLGDPEFDLRRSWPRGRANAGAHLELPIEISLSETVERFAAPTRRNQITPWPSRLHFRYRLYQELLRSKRSTRVAQAESLRAIQPNYRCGWRANGFPGCRRRITPVQWKAAHALDRRIDLRSTYQASADKGRLPIRTRVPGRSIAPAPLPALSPRCEQSALTMTVEGPKLVAGSAEALETRSVPPATSVPDPPPTAPKDDTRFTWGLLTAVRPGLAELSAH
jgi:hypothetical protein